MWSVSASRRKLLHWTTILPAPYLYTVSKSEYIDLNTVGIEVKEQQLLRSLTSRETLSVVMIDVCQVN
jgi:hypothetical protein